MAQDVKQYKVLLASPSDVRPDCKVISDLVIRWNSELGRMHKINLDPVMWESHSIPEMGDRPQSILNRQIVDESDVVIAFFWTRIGTHTGEAESGTIEEVERCMNAKKPVMLYFSDSPVSPSSFNSAEYERLKEFKHHAQKFSIYCDYKGIVELRKKVYHHLAGTILELHNQSVKHADRQCATDPLMPSDSVKNASSEGDESRPQKSWEELPKQQRDYFYSQAVKYALENEVEKFGSTSLSLLAVSLWRQEQRTWQDLRKEFMAAKRQEMKEQASENAKRAASRLPKFGRK